MTDYDFAYSLASAPRASLDGSGMVAWAISAVAKPTGSGDENFFTVPARHKTIQTPAVDLAVVNAMADSTGPQRAAKNTAYKQLLVDNLNTQNEPLVGWDAVSLELMLDNNDAASSAATDVDDYIQNVLSEVYPLRFTL